jgi:formate-dependent nitrite reductase membrane component NrfD
MFTLNVIWYLFLAGTGSGLIFVVFIIDSALRQLRPLLFLRFRPLVAPGLIIGLILTCLGGLLLALDVGRADRLLLLITHPAMSIVSLGFWMITFLVLSVLTQLLLRLVFHPHVSKTIHIITRWFSGLCALAVITYTGVLFQSMQSVAFWNTWLLPTLLVFSSISSGIALLVLLDFLGNLIHWTPSRQQRGAWLKLAHLPILLCELVVLVAYLLLMAFGSQPTTMTVELLLFGSLAPLFWLGILAAGILLPLALDWLGAPRDRAPLVVTGSLLLLLGAFVLRYCLLQVGVYPEITLFPSL